MATSCSQPSSELIGGSADFYLHEESSRQDQQLLSDQRDFGSTADLGGESDGTLSPPPEPERAPPVMARLTRTQYENTLQLLLGEGLPRFTLEVDTNPHLFYSIGAGETTLSLRGAELYSDAAAQVAELLQREPMRRLALFGCEPSGIDDACTLSGLDLALTRIFRERPDLETLEHWRALVENFGGGDPVDGLASVVEAALQSPRFLYQIASGEADPNRPGRRRYRSWELATRLAFFLTDRGPDLTLLEAAERDDLVDPQALRAHAERLLQEPTARGAIRGFFQQYLDLGRLEGVTRDPAHYPDFNARLVEAMGLEAQFLIDALVFDQEADMRELFSAPRAYVNKPLADFYGVDAPGATTNAFVPVEFPEEIPRAGFLGLGAFLTMNAHPTETSPTLRGKYLRERVLCQKVPDPPQDIDLSLEAEVGEAESLRDRLERHRSDPLCAGCHQFIDPPGYLFEHFDSVGRYRDAVDEIPIDASGELDGAPLYGARELARSLAEDPRVPACMVKQLYRFASGRLERPSEEEALTQLTEQFAASGYRFQALLLALVESPLFREVGPIAAEEEGE
ncbi:MAG: DUF1592 domain-containing protein [Myxococcota bacterium]|nr:DUF1592 domain-containing protein [Myxococcota bacterium]